MRKLYARFERQVFAIASKGASITLQQRILRGDELLIEARARVAFVCGGWARPIPKPLRISMKAEQERSRLGARGLTSVRPPCGGPAARRRVRVPLRAPFH